MDIGKKLGEALAIVIVGISAETVLLLPLFHLTLYAPLKGSTTGEIRTVEVDMKHRITVPVLFQAVNGKTFEKFPFAFEIVFNRGDEQALSETAGTTQKVNLAFCHKAVNESCLVNIDITVFYDVLEILNSYRILHTAFFCVLCCENTKNIRFCTVFICI